MHRFARKGSCGRCYAAPVRIASLVVVLVACGGGDDAMPVDAGPCIDSTHDEDGDGIGDGCDVCPAAPDPRQLDTTEAATMLAFPDRVGDACDPRPSLSGDKLGAFHPFVDAVRASDWLGSGWTIENDRARASDVARWVSKTREAGDGVYVQARIAQLAWLAGGAFDLAVDGDGVDTGLVCAITRDRDGDGNDELEAREVNGAVTTKSTPMPITGAITLTAWRVIDVQRRGTLRCRLTFEGGGAVLELPTTDDAAVGIYGFAQQAATTEVTSIVVYTSPVLPQGTN